MLNEYFRVTRLNIKSEFQYRMHIFMRILVSFIPIVCLIYLWYLLYQDQSSVKGYSFVSMITYTVLAKILYEILTPSVHWDVYSDVCSGDIVRFFTKPLYFMRFLFFKNIGLRLVSLATCVVLFGVIFLFREHFIFPEAGDILPFLLSCMMSFILFFLIYFFVSLISFWLVDIFAFFFMVGNIISFTSGALIPLDLMSGKVYNVLMLLPFSKLVYFPMSIYLGKLSLEEIINNFIVGGVWILILFLLSQRVYKLGTLRYNAPGV